MPAKKFCKDKICENCKSNFNRSLRPSGVLEDVRSFEKRRFCSHSCYSKFHRGENHVSYKPNGGITNEGYVRVNVNGERIRLHRYILEQKIGRKLKEDEHVHHIDGNKLNNSSENLEIMDNSSHRKLHTKTQKRDEQGNFIK